MANEKLQKIIYVKREYDGDESFLVCSEKPDVISEQEDTIEVGVYKLDRIANLTNQTIIEEK